MEEIAVAAGTPPLSTRLEIISADRNHAAEAWMVPKEESIEIVILGIPLDIAEDDHNCDEMGCGQDHVVLRLSMPRAFWPPRPSELPT